MGKGSWRLIEMEKVIQVDLGEMTVAEIDTTTKIGYIFEDLSNHFLQRKIVTIKDYYMEVFWDFGSVSVSPNNSIFFWFCFY